jgi:5-methylcytosine-specific restriction endonuclease McrA
MQRHTLIYLKHFGYCEQDRILCEVCKKLAVDIHHVIPRSKFGKKTKHLQDDISNLIALCRECHEKAHAKIISKETLTDIILKR